MACLNPRLRCTTDSAGDFKGAFMAGLPTADFDFFMELAAEYNSGSEYTGLIKKILNGNPTDGVAVTRQNGKVTVTVKHQHDAQGLYHLRVLASLALNDRLDKRDGKGHPSILSDRSGSPESRMYKIIAMLDIDSDSERQEKYCSYEKKPLSTLGSFEINQRFKKVRSDKKFRVGMDEIFAKVGQTAEQSLHDSLSLIIDSWDD